MANGIDWFRWHHGSVNDPKFGLVAKKAGARVGDVIAVWALILELASANTDRGLYGDIDCEATDFLLGADDGTTSRIHKAMTARGLVAEGRIARWDARQPKREREDNTAAERKRAQRQRDTAKDGETTTVTPCHATSHQDTPREEKRREEKTEPKVNTTVASAPVGSADVDRPIALVPQIPERRKETRASQDVQDVFAHWQRVMDHPQAKLDEKRAKTIAKRLSDGYTVGELRQAVDGCRNSPHHMGENRQRAIYDDIELICRDGTHVDKFIKLAAPVGIADPGLRMQVDALQEWMERP
jgi:hypothetical protein